MTISVCIPYGGGDPWRRTLFQWVHTRWSTMLPDAELIVGTSDQRPFNRSAARNAAAKQAHGDIIIFADADVIVSSDAVNQVVSELDDPYDWGFAFDVYYTMDRDWSERAVATHSQSVFPELTDEPDEHVIHRHPGEVAIECVSGCVIATRDLWLKSRGYDEQFVGWGGEDRAFAMVLERIAGAPRRPSFNALHLWHSTEDANFDQPEWKTNERRLRAYKDGRLGKVSR